MRKDKLADIYENNILTEGTDKVVTEGEKVKGQSLKTGKGFEGEDKVKQKMPNTGVGSKGVDIEKPKEAPKELNPGHDSVTEDKEIENMLPQSQFETLFKQTLVSEEMYDESPLEQDNFNDEEGDFLEISIGKPTECYAKEVEPGVFLRIDEKTKEVKSVGIFSFKKRVKDLKEVKLKLPIEVNFSQLHSLPKAV